MISSDWICDTETDCSSGEDEENCGDAENPANEENGESAVNNN